MVLATQKRASTTRRATSDAGPARVRVRLEVGIPPPPIRDMGVDLGRPQVGVAEHLLHAPEVGAALEQVGGEGVAEEVRVDTLGVEPGLRREASDDQERTCAGERSALGVEEELRAVPAVEVRPPAGQVPPQRLDRLGPERDDALLVALADAAHEALLEVDAAALEPDGLADPEAGAVEQLDQRPVAETPRGRPVRRLDQALNLAERKRTRESLAAPREVDLGRRVVVPKTQCHEVAVERACRGRPAGDRARRLAAGSQVGKPGLNLVRARVSRRAPQVGGEVGEVAAVRVDRARRPTRRKQGEEPALRTAGSRLSAVGSGARVGTVVDLSQPPRVDVAVDLGRGERRVAEQLLDRPQVGASLQQVRGEGVAEPMRIRQEAAQR